MFLINKDFKTKHKNRGLPGIGINTWDFIKEWIKCTNNKNRKVDNLFLALEPYIENWVLMIKGRTPRNVQFATLFNLIEGGEKIEVFEAWTTAHTDEDIKNICEDIFLDLLRKPPYNITVQLKQYAFVLAKLFIYRLSHKIRDWYIKQNKTFKFLHIRSFYELEIDELIDLIDKSKNKDLDFYLTYLIYAGFTSQEIISMTKSSISKAIIGSKFNESSNKNERQ